MPQDQYSTPETSPESALQARIRLLEAENADLRRRLNYDAKTGLLTEVGMREQIDTLQALLQRPADEWYWRLENDEPDKERDDRPVSELEVVMFDLDRFKTLNDTLGHGSGDEALLNFAVFLQHAFRESDIIARSSSAGDEFIVIAPITECDDGLARDEIEEKLLSSIEDMKQYPGDMPRWVALLGSSYGISRVELTQGMDLQAAVKTALIDADRQLRANKGDKAR